MSSPPFAAAKAGAVSPFPTLLRLKTANYQKSFYFFQKDFCRTRKNPTKRNGSIGYVIYLFYLYDFLHHIQGCDCLYQGYVNSLIPTDCRCVFAASDKQRH